MPPGRLPNESTVAYRPYDWRVWRQVEKNSPVWRDQIHAGGGRIDLQVSWSPTYGVIVWWSVTATGIGMTPETMAKLLLLLTQADDSISCRFGGSGLALAISRRPAQAMGGDTDVTSELGLGSCFRITFMAAAATPMRTAIKPAKICQARLLPPDDRAWIAKNLL